MLSFTKNLGGLENLFRVIRAAYLPGCTLADFQQRIPADLQKRSLVIAQFFLATRIADGKEYVVEDALIRTTLSIDWNLATARLYLFALLLNMPGQRLGSRYRQPATAQNAYVREVLHDGIGWVATNLDMDRAVEPWVRQNVQNAGAARKFTTNFHDFFIQCQFPTSRSGYLTTYANHWGPVAIRLFFDRLRIDRPECDSDELADAARSHQLHKLLGVESGWLDEIIDGAALSYVDDALGSLIATTALDSPAPSSSSTPAGRRTVQIEQLIRSTKNKLAMQGWYSKTCQICGLQLPIALGRTTVDYGHVQPLGSPHSGPDVPANMLALCPNHHRQLDGGAITIEPRTHRIRAPYGTFPPALPELLLDPHHLIDENCLRYHQKRIFKH